jgi:hypothetical protein
VWWVWRRLRLEHSTAQHTLQEHCLYTHTPESEYALWLEAIANGGSYAQLESCLGQLAGDLNQLRPTTLALVQAFFE